jgi:hypothetical protein
MKSVIKGTGYILAHTPDMVHAHNGTTQTTERIVNPDSEYLKELPAPIRSYRAGAGLLSQPGLYREQDAGGSGGRSSSRSGARRARSAPSADRYGKYGQMMPQEEFCLLMQACDVFELVELDKRVCGEVQAAAGGQPADGRDDSWPG